MIKIGAVKITILDPLKVLYDILPASCSVDSPD